MAAGGRDGERWDMEKDAGDRQGGNLWVEPTGATHKAPPMKSAYELAMDRLEKQAPSAKLTDAQKHELAEIESLYKARIAEREVFLQSQIVAARAKGDAAGIDELQTQLGREVRRLREECEEKKAKVR